MPAHRFELTSRAAFEYDAPRPDLVLRVETLRGEANVPFVLDTGAGITLFPLPLANGLGIRTGTEFFHPHHRPRTLGGALEGVRGRLVVRVGGLPELTLPCYFYQPASPPPPPPAGRAGTPLVRFVPRPPATYDEWVAAYTADGGEDETGPRRDAPCVLGRLGFLNRVDVLIRRPDFYLSAPAQIPPPRGATTLAPPPPRPPAPRRRR